VYAWASWLAFPLLRGHRPSFAGTQRVIQVQPTSIFAYPWLWHVSICLASSIPEQMSPRVVPGKSCTDGPAALPLHPRDHDPGLAGTQRVLQVLLACIVARPWLWHVPICLAKLHPGASEPKSPCDGYQSKQIPGIKNFAGRNKKRWASVNLYEHYEIFGSTGEKIRQTACLVEVHVTWMEKGEAGKQGEREWSLGSEVWGQN